MPDNRRRRRTTWLATAASVVLLPLSLVAMPGAAFAAGETLTVTLAQQTGTPTFDADDAAGNDSSATNDVIRTNDLITYQVDVAVEGGTAENTTFTITLPLGYEVNGVPAVCTGPGSSVVPSALPAPAMPLTATSYTTLGQQVVTCDVGQRAAGTSFKYPIVAKVRAEVPNGTASGPVTASLTSAAVTAPVVSNPVSSVVSSTAKWDLSKNSTALQEDSGYVTGGTGPCSFDDTRVCMASSISVLLGSGNGAKGASPLTGPITFTDDLSPASLFPAGYDSDPEWIAAEASYPGGALAKYGARLAGCSDSNLYLSPIQGIGQTGWGGVGTSTNAVRDSGSIACAQPGGAGTPATITITDTDSSLYSRPTQNGAPANNVIPSDTAYIVSQFLSYEIPLDTVKELGISDGPTQSFQMTNKYKDLTLTGLDGSPNQAGADAEWNNHRTINQQIKAGGGFDKYFVGVPGDENNTAPQTFNQGYGWAEGPPGNQRMGSGAITAAPGQTVLSGLLVRGSSPAANQVGSAIACDAWDPNLLTLTPGNYPAGSAQGQFIGSGGAAVWHSGYNHADPTPDYRIQYSTGAGGSGDASSCASGQWFDTPEAVPGGIAAVSRVRIWLTMEAGIAYPINETFFMIALTVSPTATVSTKIPNYAGVLFHFGEQQTMEQMLGDTQNEWVKSTYNPENHSGSLGDRLIAAPAYSRILKQVQGPKDSDFSNIVPITTGGDIVKYRLIPSLTSSAQTTTVTQDVTVEDCLPAGQKFVSAEIPPTLVSATTPSDATITCGPRDTFLRWSLGAKVPNQVIDPIIVTAQVSPTAPSGSFTNTARVSASNDPSTPEQRTSQAQIQIVQPAGVAIDKVALTPLVEVNRDGETVLDPLQWRIELSNIQAEENLSDPDVIDVLPVQGQDGTDYSGTLAFDSASVIDGGSSTTILYTKAATVAQDPNDASNAAGGSTTWCDAPAGGSAVIGGGTSADCPTVASEVTGLRVQRAGVFASGDVVSVSVTMIPSGNEGGDVYVNKTFGRVAGLRLPVGPVLAPEEVVASSIGDYVWLDANSDGIQDEGEQALPNFPVHLEGTDSDGNVVSLDTTTDADGKYLFDNLQSGSYVVTFDPAGLKGDQAFTIQGAGDDTGIDSDGDPATGVTGAITLGVDEQNLTIDQGVIAPPASLVVSKTVTGTGSAGPYSFTVVCTLNGEPYTLAEGDASFTLNHGESRTITLVSGVDCTVAEKDAPKEATVTVVDSDASSEGGASDGIVTAIAGKATVDITNAFPGETHILPPTPAKPTIADLAHTGVTGLTPLLVSTVLGLIAGLALLVFARRRRVTE